MNAELNNIAATILEKMPAPVIAYTQGDADDGIAHIAVPKGYGLKAIDNESLRSYPRAIKAVASLVDAASFLAYISHHNTGPATVWCDFNPVSYALSFEAVFDEHSEDMPGWRRHRAQFTPRLSVEWGTWLSNNGKPTGQLEFAEFLESNAKDIAAGEGFPSSLDMMKMATAFEANMDNRFKSKVRTASGGVELEYVNTDDEATITRMRLFERFQLGLPVFWSLREPGEAVQAWPLEARLKYRVASGVVRFHYELIRPDLVHELAALALIKLIRDGLGTVPLRMGACRP